MNVENIRLMIMELSKQIVACSNANESWKLLARKQQLMSQLVLG